MSESSSPESQRPEKEPPRSGTQPAQRKPSALPLAVLAVWMLGGAVIYFTQRPQFFDHQVGNIITLVSGFLMILSLLVWLALQQRVPIAVRVAVPVLLLASVALFFVFFRIEEVSGELVPKFTYRFAPPDDAQLGPQEVSNAGVELIPTTDMAFPQFLGPDRDLSYRAATLADDWQSTPPEQLWRQPIGAGWSGFVAVNGFAITLEQRGEQEQVNCYEIATGRLCWSHSHPWRHETLMGGVGPRSTPTIANGRVYALGAGGLLMCLTGETGELIWQRDLLQEFGVSPEDDAANIAWGRAASPLAVDDKVIVPAGGPTGAAVSLVAYNAESGEEMWRGGSSQISYASPALATLGGMQQVVIVNESSVAGHRLDNGQELWSYPWPGSSNTNASVSQAVGLDGSQILLSKGYSGGSALLKITEQAGQWKAEEVWANSRVLKTKFTNVAIREQTAYGLSDGILEAVEIDTGQRLWKRGRYGHGQILLVQDKLLVLGESGELHLLGIGSEAPRDLGEIQALSGKSWNTLCLYGKTLLIRNSEEAACYRLP